MPDANEPKAKYVTRGEFYIALGFIFLFVAMGLAPGAWRSDESILGLIAHCLVFGTAIVTSMVFSIMGAKTRVAERKWEKQQASTSGKEK
jgi:protein-S-isoprenylcysteine O-methyltransferase Ste14